MKKFSLLLIVAAGLWAKADAQVKFGNNPVTINAGSLLELESTNKGFLPTRVTLTDRLVWGLAGTPVTGMIVYSNALGANGLDTGLVVWQGQWNLLTTITKTDASYWKLKGNAGTVPPTTLGTPVGASNFWGTTDTQNLAVGTNGITRAIFDQHGSLFGGRGTFDANMFMMPSWSLVWGDNNKDSANYALMYGNGNTLAQNGIGSIVGGTYNYSRGNASAVFGASNKDSADWSLVSGAGNILSPGASTSAVFGGSNKLVGLYNDANVVGGTFNKVDADAARNSIITGDNNLISGSTSNNNALSGVNNTIFNSSSSVVSGDGNKLANASNAAIFGSLNIDSASSNIIGGEYNTIRSTGYQSIVGGRVNNVETPYSIVVGTANRTVNANFGFGPCAVFGDNNVDSARWTLIAGFNNIVSPGMAYGTVVGRHNQPVNGALFTVGTGTGFLQRKNALTVLSTQTTGAAVNGNIVFANLPKYNTPADAVADASLPSGAMYFLTTGGPVYVKP
ncbi:hypothetical protein [Edaphocola flava]|uniref:hypothetical protein n=1 Tax=Edaphocola flava TaxID=2499629 RepID=UPI00100AFE13|nr:hypothetical protein [Edaphocola flava]